MFCGDCGTQNPDTNAFCKNCGKPVKKPVLQGPPQQITAATANAVLPVTPVSGSATTPPARISSPW